MAEAAGSYFTATVSAPGNLYARMHLGSCLRRLGRWQEAVEAFQIVLPELKKLYRDARDIV